MSKVLLEVDYMACGVLKNATIEVEAGYTDSSVLEALKRSGAEADTILNIEEYEDVTDAEDSGNAGCDNAGFCVGMGCKYYFTVCHKGAI